MVRDTLHCFSQGMQVAMACLLMAADAGLVATDREVIPAGTAVGASQPMRAASAVLDIREVLARPWRG